MKSFLLVSTLLALALLAAACRGEAWTQGQHEEAYRLCRAEAGFPPISVFEESGGGSFNTFMCTCEVAYLAERVSYAKFKDGKHVPEVNHNLMAGRSNCLFRYRKGER